MKLGYVVLVSLFAFVATALIVDEEFFYSKKRIMQNEQYARHLINTLNTTNTLQGEDENLASFFAGLTYYHKGEKYIGIPVPSGRRYNAGKRVLRRWAKKEGLYGERGLPYSGGDRVYVIAK